MHASVDGGAAADVFSRVQTYGGHGQPADTSMSAGGLASGEAGLPTRVSPIGRGRCTLSLLLRYYDRYFVNSV